jgi:hypothetical protein
MLVCSALTIVEENPLRIEKMKVVGSSSFLVQGYTMRIIPFCLLFI